MKTPRKTLLIIVVLACMMSLSPGAYAIPNLQIYIPGADYDAATETWIINSYHYDLWVIGAKQPVKDVKLALAVPESENGSILIEWLAPAFADYGSARVPSVTLVDPGMGIDPDRLFSQAYGASYASEYPQPETYGFGEDANPLMGNGKPLLSHGVFPSDFYEYFIGDFGTDQIVQNYIPGAEWGDTAPGQMKKFHVDVSGYSWLDIAAYDHIVHGRTKAKYVLSPFSHDGGGTAPVPEPATAFLLGTGLISLGAFCRKKLK